jgi:hypothetical protein
VDLGIDLYLTQLLREEAVETTWPQIQPHLGQQLSEWLDPAAPLSGPPVVTAEGPHAWTTT